MIPGVISNPIDYLLCVAGVAHLYSHVFVHVSCACQRSYLIGCYLELSLILLVVCCVQLVWRTLHVSVQSVHVSCACQSSYLIGCYQELSLILLVAWCVQLVWRTCTRTCLSRCWTLPSSPSPSSGSPGPSSPTLLQVFLVMNRLHLFSSTV